jgi:glycosyltransferase
MTVSIITATYNSQETVLDTLLSVASQSYPDIEHIIIDGLSTDRTLEIIKQNASRISKIISEPDKGIYDALNKGIKTATGDIICFLHADDIFADNQVITDVVNLMKQNDTDAVYADLQYVSKSNTDRLIRYWKSGYFSKKKLKRAWMPPHPTFIVKKKIYDNCGLFDINFKISADYDIILRFLGVCNISVAYLPRVTVKMRIGGKSNASIKNIILKMLEDKKALQKNKLGNIHTVFLKNLIKIPQWFNKN